MIKIGAESVDKLNSDLIQRDLKRVKRSESELEPVNFDSEDKVELSPRALDLKEMQAKAMSSSDTRTELIQQIKMKIDEGTYSISSEKIAGRIIDEAMET